MAAAMRVKLRNSYKLFSNLTVSCKTADELQLQICRYVSQWHLMSAMCLERKPITTAELTQIEKEYSALIDRLEFEKSLKSSHELRHEDDIKRAERIKKSEIEDSDLEAITKITAQDMEDAATEELNTFQFASRETEADKTNNKRSLDRCLSRHLFFVIKEKLGKDCKWLFPQTIRKNDENMRQAAERVFQEICGNTVKAQFIGNAPIGYYKYRYPKPACVEGVIGAKIFFFKAWYKEGDISLDTLKKNTGREDCLWLTREELQGLLHKHYWKSIDMFLVDESVPKERKTRKDVLVRRAARAS